MKKFSFAIIISFFICFISINVVSAEEATSIVKQADISIEAEGDGYKVVENIVISNIGVSDITHQLKRHLKIS